ncbi:hypothetical protein HMPREF3226_02408 [Prevotella corporis]|uniref:Uncharacterized protein n=1 Tax=Prevotella corporis TaxID=28128 RepID=A0A133PVV0_9BACT|nr:hypothetical protein HMPREF3226_02408 [Prevotella corporis]
MWSSIVAGSLTLGFLPSRTSSTQADSLDPSKVKSTANLRKKY